MEEDFAFDLVLKDALDACKLGIEFLIHCDRAGITKDEAFDLITSRGEYLKQEPEVNQE